MFLLADRWWLYLVSSQPDIEYNLSHFLYIFVGSPADIHFIHPIPNISTVVAPSPKINLQHYPDISFPSTQSNISIQHLAYLNLN